MDSSRLINRLPVFAACCLFITLGVLFIPLAGIQADEAIFTISLYESNPYFLNRILHFPISTMILSYLGSLKTLVYFPLLKIASGNVWTLRLPMVLAGSLTIFIFYRLAALSVSRRAALTGAFLLASDPIFLMTGTFDWGPVALEHLLLVTGCYCLFQFERKLRDGRQEQHILRHASEKWLAAGFFCFGLALWNKATFLWALAGLTAASLAMLRPYIRRSASLRNISIAVAAFALGAAPLIAYNLRHFGSTLRQEAYLAPVEIPAKWEPLKRTFQGSALFGYITADEQPETRKSSGFYYALGLLLLLVPVWRKSRAAWFSLIFCAVSWLLMAMTHGGGLFAHHVVLLWPFPILFVAAVLDRLPRLVGIGAAIVLVAANLFVVSQYFFQLKEDGTAKTFSDAIFPLSSALDDTTAPIYVADWGIAEPLGFLHQGRLKLRRIHDQLRYDAPDAAAVRILTEAVHDPNGVFITHLPQYEIFPDSEPRFDARIADAGMLREVLQVINDSKGRPVFEISRMVPAP